MALMLVWMRGALYVPFGFLVFQPLAGSAICFAIRRTNSFSGGCYVDSSLVDGPLFAS